MPSIIIVGKGPSANSIRLDLPRFTLIGATTGQGSFQAPCGIALGVSLRLELYTTEELAKIVTRSAALLGMEIDPEGAVEIASRSGERRALPTGCSAASGTLRRFITRASSRALQRITP